jgi:hypothetical protein
MFLVGSKREDDPGSAEGTPPIPKRRVRIA